MTELTQNSPLAGGGEMGALMRAFDWSTTAVGAPDSWPQSLRTALSILLETRFPMYIAWGPEFIQFYNDGYRPILGSTKHPAALGLRTRETFAEIWEIIGPMFHGVMKGEAVFLDDFMLPLDRHGFVEECYFIFSYSPIRDESLEVGGVLVTVTETTQRVLSERRLRTLRDLPGRASGETGAVEACRADVEVLQQNAADLPFALVYLVDDPLTAHLVASTGLGPDHAASAPTVDLRASEDQGWPLGRVVATGKAELVTDVMGRFGPLPGTKWPEPIHSALLLPIARPGQERPYGVLVAGLSPRLAIDDNYRSFCTLVADNIATAISAARAYDEERRRAQVLAELDRAKTDFFSNVSHEFRTPLTLLLAPLEETLRADSSIGTEDRASLEVAHSNALRLLKLVNSLLDFARIESGRTQVAFEPVDLSKLTVELAAQFQSAVDRAGLRLSVECPPLGEDFWVDSEMYEKIVLNLLSNAFKFTFNGTIGVRLRLDESEVVLEVQDTGTGIPASELSRVFDRFHRVREARSRSHEGSGIGLALVRELVAMHGGTVEVASREGEGSLFTVKIRRGFAHLPAESVHAKRETPAAAHRSATYLREAQSWIPDSSEDAVGVRPPAQSIPHQPPTRILLADDNRDMRSYALRLLSQHWTVEAVADGAAALASARKNPPDLIVSDVMMPEMDGFALLAALKSDPTTASIPVILLSARAGEEASIEGMNAGADDYLVKPFSARELVSRVAARVEIARARSDAARAHARLRAHFMQAPVAVCVLTGPDLVFELANPLYEVMVERSVVEGQTLREVFPELPPDAPIFQTLQRVYRTGIPFSADEFCVRLKRPDTGVVEDTFFKFTCQPIRDPTGAVAGSMVVAVDVTEHVRARKTIEDSDRRKNEFLAMLGHELRNPLAALSTALAVMKPMEQDPEKLVRLRDTGQRQLGNVVRLVDDLLDVSRITTGKVDLRRVPSDLGAVVQNGIQTARSLVEARRHVLVTTVEGGPLRVLADPMRLEQVVSNLVSNAAKFTEPGGRIEVTVSREDSSAAAQGTAVVKVRDNGRGLPADAVDQIFDLFVQVNSSLDRSIGGLGIGLTLVKSLVEMHGGTVQASSDGLGKGTELTVRLPLIATDARPAPAARPSPIAPARRRVLLIEDSEDVRESLREYLSDLGHEVSAAGDGLSGIREALQVAPEVALVDVGLPGIDGYEVARRLRETAVGKSILLVAVTGYGGSEVRDRALAAGFDLHLVKPLNLDALPEVLAQARSR